MTYVKLENDFNYLKCPGLIIDKTMLFKKGTNIRTSEIIVISIFNAKCYPFLEAGLFVLGDSTN